MDLVNFFHKFPLLIEAGLDTRCMVSHLDSKKPDHFSLIGKEILDIA